jgi:hypothetical protein
MPVMDSNASAPAQAGHIIANLAQEPSGTIHMPVAKAVGAITTATGAQLIDSAQTGEGMFSQLLTLTWPNLAAAAACLYSLSLLVEFCWKKFWRPFLERVGWVKPRPRRVLTASEWAALRPEEKR